MEFRVVAVSIDRNSFGLRGVVLMAKTGTTFQVASNDLHLPAVGQILDVPLVSGIGPHFGKLGFEIPERLPVAPPRREIDRKSVV